MLTVQNVSDETVYLQWSEEADALTTSNGYPLVAAGIIRIPASDNPNRPKVSCIHGGAGDKELRYVAE